MVSLDHMILRVRNQAESVRFYQQILAFKHEGRADPFDILRVHEGLTLDLIQQVPQDQVHLAFCLERAAFEAIHRRLANGGNGSQKRRSHSLYSARS